MADREKVIEDLVEHIESTLAVCDEFADGIPLDLLQYTVHLLKEHDSCENCAIAIEDRQPIVRCKDCIHRGKAEKCVLAAISEEKDYPLFMLDNRGEWFCADGEKKGR